MNMSEILDELGIATAPEGHHHVSSHSGFLGVDCPYCSPDTGRFRMGVKAWVATCFLCGVHPLRESLALAGKVPFTTVNRALRHLAYEPALKRKPTHGKYLPPGMRCPLARPHRKYLRKRGFDPDEIFRTWGVEGIGLHPRLSWTVFIPIYECGEPVSWTTRSIVDGPFAGYISARPEEEAVPHKSLLYGEDHCTNTIVVVEGPLDVWAIGPGAVCTFGTQYTSDQMLRMSRYPRRVIMMDSEPEAQRVARRLCRDLSVFDGETVNVVLESGKDASRADRREIALVRKKFLGGN